MLGTNLALWRWRGRDNNKKNGTAASSPLGSRQIDRVRTVIIYFLLKAHLVPNRWIINEAWRRRARKKNSKSSFKVMIIEFVDRSFVTNNAIRVTEVWTYTNWYNNPYRASEPETLQRFENWQFVTTNQDCGFMTKISWRLKLNHTVVNFVGLFLYRLL